MPRFPYYSAASWYLNLASLIAAGALPASLFLRHSWYAGLYLYGVLPYFVYGDGALPLRADRPRCLMFLAMILKAFRKITMDIPQLKAGEECVGHSSPYPGYRELRRTVAWNG